MSNPCSMAAPRLSDASVWGRRLVRAAGRCALGGVALLLISCSPQQERHAVAASGVAPATVVTAHDERANAADAGVPMGKGIQVESDMNAGATQSR